MNVLVFLSVLLPSFLEGGEDWVHDIQPSPLSKVSIDLTVFRIASIGRSSCRLKQNIFILKFWNIF